MTKQIVDVWNDEVDDFVEEEYIFEPCPKCGSERDYVELNYNIIDEDWWRVVCEACGYKSEYIEGLSNAIHIWNKESKDA